MRRLVALLAALVLLGSLAGSSVAANPVPRSSFTGDFNLLLEDGTPWGHATAQLVQPTDQRPVPGHFDFRGVPGIAIRESHAQIGQVHFYYDPNHWPNGARYPGANVVRAEGVECVYIDLNNADCHQWAMMLIDNKDPSVPNQAAFAISKLANGDWDFQYWQIVGRGDFVLRFSGIES